MAAPALVLLDVNETLSDLEPLRERFTQVGAPAALLDTWFAGTLRDGFALAAAGSSAPFRDVATGVLTGLLAHVEGLAVPVGEAVDTVLDGMQQLDVHPDVPAGLHALADAGVRVATLTNGGVAQTETLLGRAGLLDLVERRLSVQDAGRWKPHPDAYRYAAQQCGVPLGRCALVAVHPWDLQGAAAVGLTTGFLDRRHTPWPGTFPRPDITGNTLAEVAQGLVRAGQQA